MRRTAVCRTSAGSSRGFGDREGVTDQRPVHPAVAAGLDRGRPAGNAVGRFGLVCQAEREPLRPTGGGVGLGTGRARLGGSAVEALKDQDRDRPPLPQELHPARGVQAARPTRVLLSGAGQTGRRTRRLLDDAACRPHLGPPWTDTCHPDPRSLRRNHRDAVLAGPAGSTVTRRRGHRTGASAMRDQLHLQRLLIGQSAHQHQARLPHPAGWTSPYIQLPRAPAW